MRVINLFAGPGAGKSVTSSVLYGMLSLAGYNVQYVAEFAKFATYSGNNSALSDQIYMFAKQANRLHVLKGVGLDFVIMDGPLPLSLLHTPPEYYSHFKPLVLEVFNGYDNINFMLQRNPAVPYQTNGRSQTEAQALDLCHRTESLLIEHQLPYDTIRVDEHVAHRLFGKLTSKPAPLLALAS